MKQDNKTKICPICKVNPVYKIFRKVKSGYTEKNNYGGYFFIQTGWHTVKDEYWSCKSCANNSKKINVNEYNQFLIDHQDEIL